MLGMRLKASRKRAGYTQQSLAESLGVSVRTVTFWEAGERTPSLELLVKIAGILGVSTDYLLGIGSTEPPPPDDVAAHTDSDMTPEMEQRIQEIAREIYLRLRDNE